MKVSSFKTIYAISKTKMSKKKHIKTSIVVNYYSNINVNRKTNRRTKWIFRHKTA